MSTIEHISGPLGRVLAHVPEPQRRERRLYLASYQTKGWALNKWTSGYFSRVSGQFKPVMTWDTEEGARAHARRLNGWTV